MLWNFLQLLFLAPLMFRQTSVVAQESPSLFADKFDTSQSFRTNVCRQQEMLWNQQVDLPNALRGLNLTVGITNYQTGKEVNFFSLVNNRILETSPGYFAVILDEVARRAGFSWRNSFGVYAPRNNITDGDKSWTDIMIWAINTYDISMEKWGQSVDRMAKGASFPFGFWDSSAVLGELFQPSQQKRVVQLWSFLAPFESAVWICIAVAVVLTGMVYWILEYWNKDTDERELDGKPIASIFYAAIAFTGHYELRPNSHAARILGFSFTFWSLIVASAYTANLASFLVSPKVTVYQYSTMKDAIRKDARLCVQGGAILQQILEEKYPGIKTVGKDSEFDVFQGLRVPIEEGGCDAVAHQFNSFELYEHTKEVNYDCAVSSEKRVVENLPAGMATLVDNGPVSSGGPGSPPKCTSLISHVLDYHLTAMQNEGFLEEAWRKHLSRTGTVECISENNGGGGGLEETFSLSVHDVGGIFIVHFVLCMLAIALATYQFYVKARTDQIEGNRTLGKAFGVHHVKSISKMSMVAGAVASRAKLPVLEEEQTVTVNAERAVENDSSTTKNMSQQFELSEELASPKTNDLTIRRQCSNSETSV